MCLCNSCSGLRLWIPVLDELTEGNGNSVHIPWGITVFDEFLDPTGSDSHYRHAKVAAGRKIRWRPAATKTAPHRDTGVAIHRSPTGERLNQRAATCAALTAGISAMADHAVAAIEIH